MRAVDLNTEKFANAVQQIKGLVTRPDITLTEVPAPARLAPFSMALTAEPTDLDSDGFTGRFVLLHDPDGVDEWHGTFRVVIFIRAQLEADLLNDDLVRQVAWSWITESNTGLNCLELGGTVTTNCGESFGSLSDRPSDGFVEVRASWTPMETHHGVPTDSLALHMNAWIQSLEIAGGLTPLSDGVVPVISARNRG